MSWKLLPTNFKEALWSGLKKYKLIQNDDDTVSLEDVTEYIVREFAFFNSYHANRMNEALNIIMSMIENGTNVYEAFLIYFEEQKIKFENQANINEEQWRREFEVRAEQWFDTIRGILNTDAAGNLQNQLTALTSMFGRLQRMVLTNDFAVPISTDDDELTVIVDDTGFAIMADWKYIIY